MGIKLGDLFVGYADGKTEAESVEHDFVDLFYIGNSKVSEVNKSNSFIISGRKGVGKTILAMYVKKQFSSIHGMENARYIYLPDELKREEFIERQIYEVKSDEYNLFAQYYIYKTISDTIINNNIKPTKFFSSNRLTLTNIRRYFRYRKSKKYLQKWRGERYAKRGYYKKGFETTSNYSTEGNISANLNSLKSSVGESVSYSTNAQYMVTHFSNEIVNIKQAITDCVNVKPIFIVFDDVDDMKIYFGTSADLNAFLIGFIKAVNAVNKTIVPINNHNKCIIIIRDDILRSLNAYDSNLNKIISDSEVNIDWVGNNEEEALFEMIFNKIAKSTPQLKGYNYARIIQLLFRDRKKGQDALNKMLERSFGRPRDIINYLKIIFDRYADNHYIDHQCIMQTYSVYSSKFWGELTNELAFYYDAEYINCIKKLLSSYGQKNFYYTQLKNFFDAHKADYPAINNFDEFMESLYHFGIIGSFRTHPNQTNRASFYYRRGSKRQLDKNDKISVHYGLRPEFNL